MAELAELQRRFREFAATCHPRAPLYESLASAVADHPDIAGLMLVAPAEQHLPTLLFCCVHDLVLRGAAPQLARFFPNLTRIPARGDPFPAFRAAVHEHADELTAMLATRHTQTNEIGRCALFLPLLGVVSEEVGDLSLVDIGTSAGLNQRLDYYDYVYEPGGRVGNSNDGSSSVQLHCGTRGAVPVPLRLPVISATVGLDSQPIDVSDDDAVRWLEACVFPDQADRFHRLRAAIAIARRDPPVIRRGDAVDDARSAIAAVAGTGHPVVLNSWVLSYLTVDRQREYVAELDRFGADHDLSWVLAESPALTRGLPIPTTVQIEHLSVLSLVTWRSGKRTVRRAASCHPHGYWMHWE